ncbi:hypothetical protein GQ53DRAFT_350809 [Thozetella sp. PMI_491]|nr:hypothetical protein GQ53DRAFT_350809 [Thozetella sp. PMI_491]
MRIPYHYGASLGEVYGEPNGLGLSAPKILPLLLFLGLGMSGNRICRRRCRCFGRLKAIGRYNCTVGLHCKTTQSRPGARRASGAYFQAGYSSVLVITPHGSILLLI